MKKVTSITINNFRAFLNSYDPIILENGENLLVYGENGSGKSSLYKAFQDFLASSRNPALPFTKNTYSSAHDGNIDFEFKDFDTATQRTVPASAMSLVFGSAGSTNSVQFVKDADLIKGFLDYRNLLDVYFHKEANPNLFNLIVLNLLNDHISVGATYKIGEKWKELQKNLIELPYNRRDYLHTSALAELPVYQGVLIQVLIDIFVTLNRLLATYFPFFELEMGFVLQNLDFIYGRYKGDWRTNNDLRLQIRQYGAIIINYNDTLNEARLSALSVCLYLSALLQNPTAFEYKILFLDDVFVGLDAGNRLPILNMLLHEFADYQIIISTYDRHWFELAKRHFEFSAPKKWVSCEFYVGRTDVPPNQYDSPIIVMGKSNYDKAVQYLHNRSQPDYPAAANYFRKSLEELIIQNVPKWELADAESTQIADHKLTALVIQTRNFLTKTFNDVTSINTIISLLSALLHPLSHHEISSPIYKRELLIIEENIRKLADQFKVLDVPSNYKCCLGSGKTLKITFTINGPGNHFGFYEIVLKEAITLRNNPGGTPIVSNVHCVANRSYGHNNLIPYRSVTFDRKNPLFNYSTLENAYDTIYAFLTTLPGIGAFSKEANYLNAFQYYNETGWEPLNSIIIW